MGSDRRTPSLREWWRHRAVTLPFGNPAYTHTAEIFITASVMHLTRCGACKHLFIGEQTSVSAAVTWRHPVCFRR
ncbi:hypothetical protein [Synechococcus sp. M16CYN]|uniref:hypothetical protein n=1 Tax=Synechococcus sp. M16CYN TaxID=3103139 RepID=UPI0033417E5F